MVLLGCDPGFSNYGLVLVETNGDNLPKVLKHETLKASTIRSWLKGLPILMEGIEKFVGRRKVNKAGIEMISWYGRRRGVLALAHLAGASFGLLSALDIPPKFFTPKLVKETSATFPAPEGFTVHEHDALSLCRLLVAD